MSSQDLFLTKLAALDDLLSTFGQGKPSAAQFGKLGSLSRSLLGTAIEAAVVDEDLKFELQVFLDNEAKLYNQKKSIIANIMRKLKAGKYDPRLAPKLWLYWVDAGAKLYQQEMDLKIPRNVREALAEEIADSEYRRIQDGEYGNLAKMATEEKESRFEEGKPADPTENMSPEDAKKWREEHLNNKDNFKSAAEVTASRTKHLPGEDEDHTACGEQARKDTLVDSVKDATCYYCKQAWERKHKAASFDPRFASRSANEAFATNLLAEINSALVAVEQSKKANGVLAKKDLHTISEKLVTALQEESPSSLGATLWDLRAKTAKIYTHFAGAKRDTDSEARHLNTVVEEGIAAFGQVVRKDSQLTLKRGWEDTLYPVAVKVVQLSKTAANHSFSTFPEVLKGAWDARLQVQQLDMACARLANADYAELGIDADSESFNRAKEAFREAEGALGRAHAILKRMGM